MLTGVQLSSLAQQSASVSRTPPPGGATEQKPASQASDLFGVDSSGDLHWYHYNLDESGNFAGWAEQQVIGNGWDIATHIVSSFDNVIYAVLPNGDMFWYQWDATNHQWSEWNGSFHSSGWEDTTHLMLARSQGCETTPEVPAYCEINWFTKYEVCYDAVPAYTECWDYPDTVQFPV